MSDHNLMAAFITGEDGTTSLLATLLNLEYGHPTQANFRQRFAVHLTAAGISLPHDVAPVVIRQQYMNMDLVIVWQDWVIVLENKVQAASITRNQLNRYYRVALKTMQAGEFLDDAQLAGKRLGILYLTP